MLPRPSLEIALQDMINAKSTHLFIDIIHAIRNQRHANEFRLDGADEQGRVLLALALENDMHDIANEIFELQQDNKKIIYSETNAKQTLISLAAQHGHEAVLEKIICSAKQVRPGNLGYKQWLQPDEHGDTPLHYAAKNHHIKSVKILLNDISLESSAINHINRLNDRGETPLHLACEASKYPFATYGSIGCNDSGAEIAALLIDEGADVTVKNQDGMSPFDIIYRQAFSAQFEFISMLSEQSQRKLFNHYSAYLADNPDQSKETFYRLTSLFSLQTLVSSRLELDDEFQEEHHELNKHYSHLELLRSGCQVDNESKCSYQLLVEDQVTLIHLLESVEQYLADLRTRPIRSMSNKALGILTCVSMMLVYVGIMAWLIQGTIKLQSNQTDEGRRLSEMYDRSTIFFGMVGLAFFAFVGSALGACIATKDVFISRDEWKDIINNLQDNVLTRLQDLESIELKHKLRDQHADIDYLPVPAQMIRTLENKVAQLNEDKKSINKVRKLFERLSDVLLHLQRQLYLTNKPFSLFHHSSHDLIDMTISHSSSGTEYSIEEMSSSESEGDPIFTRNDVVIGMR